jgi:hypothetical protein
VKYVMEVLRPFWYWTLWMSKRHTVTHEQKTFVSGQNGWVRVDSIRQSGQRHPGGRLLRARRQ